MTAAVDDVAVRLLDVCRVRGLMVATAESCTGGMVAMRLTDIAGSSEVMERGFVTYSNRAKKEMLGVSQTFLETFGAVSVPVACAMAEGALRHSAAQVSVAITGIAGPGGGSAEKPVGLVHFATAKNGSETRAIHRIFPGTRAEIRKAAADFALSLLLERAEED